MKKFILMVSVVLLILCVGCTKATPNANIDSSNGDDQLPEEPLKAQQLRIVSVHENTFNYVLVPEDRSDESIYIIGDDIDGLVEEYGEVEVQGSGSGAIIKIEVIGSIYDFNLIKLIWDEENEQFRNGDIVHTIDEVKDQAIFINSSLPCGMPIEVIEWKNKDGKEFSAILSADGYGFSGSVIWSK